MGLLYPFSCFAPAIRHVSDITYRRAKMRISDVIGLLSAFIGSTATLFGAWAYIRSQHPSKGELLRAALVIIVMMAAVAGLAMGISRATTITVNGRDSIPVPHPFSSFSTPANSS